MKWLRCFLLLLVLGAIINVAVACAVANSAGPLVELDERPLWTLREEAMTPMELEALLHFESIGFTPTPRMRCMIFHNYPRREVAVGRDSCCWRELEKTLSCFGMRQGFLATRRCVIQCSAGWPMLALSGEMFNRTSIVERAASIGEVWHPHAAFIVRGPVRRSVRGIV